MQHEHGNSNYCYYVIIVPIVINTCMSSSNWSIKMNNNNHINKNNGTDDTPYIRLIKIHLILIESRQRFSVAYSINKVIKYDNLAWLTKWMFFFCMRVIWLKGRRLFLIGRNSFMLNTTRMLWGLKKKETALKSSRIKPPFSGGC